MFRSQALGHGSVGRGKLAACMLRTLPGTPAAMPARGEDGLAGGTDPGQQEKKPKQHNPGDVTSVNSLCNRATGKGGFPVGSAQAALVPRKQRGGMGCLQGGLSCRSLRYLI